MSLRLHSIRNRLTTLEAIAKPVVRSCKGTVLTVPNSRPPELRLQPLRANDGAQGLKPASFRSGIGTTEVVPLLRSEEVLRQLLRKFLFRRSAARAGGFTLIELMIVMTIILILISIAAPMYRSSIIRSKEAVLRDDLFTLRSVIDQYTLDKQEAPQSLADLVEAGYLRELPTDPFTSSGETWIEEFEDTTIMMATQTTPGIVDVHSGSNLTSLSGEPYSDW